MKKILLIVYILLSMVAAEGEAATVTLAWDPAPSADGYRVFERLNGENYDYENPAWTGNSTTATLNALDKTPTYYVVRAYIASKESRNSNEVMHYSGNKVNEKVNFETLYSNVYEIEPLIPCQNYTVFYREYGNNSWISVNRIGNDPYPLLLPQGLWEIRVTTYDQNGFVLSDEINLKYAPKMKVDYLSASATNLAELALLVRWDDLCHWAADYEIRTYGFLRDALNLNDNFLSQDTVPASQAEKATYLPASNANHFFFVAVVPYDSAGQIIDMGVQIGWVQPGNIIGTFNTGTSWDQARVDSADYNYLSINWYKTVANRPFDYVNGLSAYNGFSHQEIADSNNDGTITAPDLQMLQLHWMRSGSSYY
jgi:hypothetical protein